MLPSIIPIASRGNVVAGEVLQLQFVARIPQQKLKQSENEDLYCYGLCALSDDIVLFACGTDGLRGLSLKRSKLIPNDISTIKEVYGVAFDLATDTLLLAIVEWKSDPSFFEKVANFLEMPFSSTRRTLWLTSLQRGTDGWTEVERVQTDLTCFVGKIMWVGISTMSGSRVLLGGGENRDRLYSIQVSPDHRLHRIGSVDLENKVNQFACTREGVDTLVAFSHTNCAVSLHRLAALQLEPLARVQLSAPSRLLFLGRLLLVADWNKKTETHNIVSFATTGGKLTGKRQLIEATKASALVDEWCVAGIRLVVRDGNSNDLLLYTPK